ncbi:hypothetical protein V2W30_40070 (plasmid) [Streptomyces sp. Q6]|uniref:Uncharacterized protein n=1 Tax=Streptomyces citrinus TaxID=3118173 RepID=A0ACD5AQC7_9ACTN
MTAGLAAAAVLLVTPAVSAASTPEVVHAAGKRLVGHAGPYDIVVTYTGSGALRKVNFVYASKFTKSKRQLSARWMYITPNGPLRTSGWARTTRVDSGPTWRAKSWGPGKKIPKNSKVCTQFKGSSTLACVKVA